MARYLMLWEMDRDKIPVDPKERARAWSALTALVKQDLAKGVLTSWGAFVGEMKGYCIAEGEDLEVNVAIQHYTPYAYFQTFPLATIDTVEEMLKRLSG